MFRYVSIQYLDSFLEANNRVHFWVWCIVHLDIDLVHVISGTLRFAEFIVRIKKMIALYSMYQVRFLWKRRY